MYVSALSLLKPALFFIFSMIKISFRSKAEVFWVNSQHDH